MTCSDTVNVISEASPRISYTASFAEGARVRLSHPGHPHHLCIGTVRRLLINPSQQENKQWYDVKFDDGAWGRFIERHLETVDLAQVARR